MSVAATLAGASLALFSPPLADSASIRPPAPAVSGPVLVTGRVTDERGLAVPGPVSVSIMPRDVARGDTYPVVARGIANRYGVYAAVVDDQATLTRIAATQGGWVETITASDNAVSASAALRSIQVASDDAGLRLSARRQTRDGETVAVRPESKPLDLRVKNPVPILVRAVAGPSRACNVTPLWKVVKEETRPAWTVVGELNNAYNDGTVATFTYGQQGHAETTVGIAVAVNQGGFSIEEQTTITDSATIGFPPFKRRLARKLRTQFNYKRTTERRTCEATGVSDTRTTIRAVQWQGGTNISAKQPGALNKCVRRGSWGPGGSFERSTGRAVRFTAGTTVFNVSLTTQSGFSKNVTTTHTFGRGKRHYLCGPDGKQSPMVAGRIFSGGKPVSRK